MWKTAVLFSSCTAFVKNQPNDWLFIELILVMRCYFPLTLCWRGTTGLPNGVGVGNVEWASDLDRR